MANRLADEPSPYLRQHAENPVEWWPWCDAAFQEAKERDVPVLLSIGYATCHWCHVMAHESFEDDEVAALLNEHFVCIKVDREERPDIDAAYMAACQAANGSGGWPLTAVLDHDRRPWFVGTYFAKESRGRIGMMELIPKLAEAWHDRREEVQASSQHLLDHVAHGANSVDPSRITMDLVTQAVADLKARFDPAHGGFGGAPKFPSPHQLMLLLRHHHRTGDPDALHMVLTTLNEMERGGIHDHVGGGFHRYSTDAEWHLPHFEKMLYDQAMLMMAYTEAFQVTGAEVYADVVEDIADYVMRDLRHPDGGFFCAEDADSEGEEGTFYIWDALALQTTLGAEAGPFMEAYGCLEGGNFMDEATRQPVPSNILHRQPGVPHDDFTGTIGRLFQAREERIRPGLDDKVLTDWNGLMLAAFAKAGNALGRNDLLDVARSCAHFLLDHLRDDDGNLLHRWHAGRTDHHAFLDDHAFLAWGLLELYHADADAAWLTQAMDVATRMLERHARPNGALQLASLDGETMVLDATKAYDGAIPSGTSIAVLVLERLGRLTADPAWTEAAWNAVRHVERFDSHPSVYAACMLALPGLLGKGTEVVVAGQSKASREMHEVVRRGYHPDTAVIRHDGSAKGLPEWVQAYDPRKDAAYVCRDQSCDAPVFTTDAMLAAL